MLHAAYAEGGYVVHSTDVVDRKAVIATVEPVLQLVGRAHIGGTIASLTVKEGDTVAAGQQIAVVTDEKLAVVVLGLGRIALRLRRGDARVERLHLQSWRDAA